jgi:predicted O-linked N-acetylglucosamine transferase (SPINDLY family)
MRELPGSKLYLKRCGLDDPSVTERILGLFAEHGIPSTRIILESHTSNVKSHLECYNRADICLDTFPYNGTTTTCEALWMGVPVVTLCGAHHACRVSTSILRTAGLGELSANNPDTYKSIVCNLAQNESFRLNLMDGIRERLVNCGLCDGASFTRKFEAAVNLMVKEKRR